MADKLNRREFVKATAAGLAAGLGAAREAVAAEPKPAAPAVGGSRAKPVVVSSANGRGCVITPRGSRRTLGR